MDCRNHPGVQAVDRCAGCAEAFCENCLVEIQGQKFCGSCKVMAIRGQPPLPMPGAGTRTCKEAKEALAAAIIGLFCCGIILEPFALIKANSAKKMIEADPTLTGGGMATAAQVIAIIGLVLWVIAMLVKVGQFGQM